VNDIIEPPSLLPYLNTDDARFYIKISVADQNDSMHEKSSFPFWVVSESGQFARILDAGIKTDVGTHIEPLFLLIQKDEHPVSQDVLRPFDNRSIDRYWQDTFIFHSREKSGSPPLILKDQMGKNGTLLPFQPLFYCKFNRTYFPALCPDCGKGLQQCYDDGMLQEYGLRPYSTSLKRYLFCPSCAGLKKPPDFYVSSLADDDPEFLKDRFELIKEFGRLYENKNYAGRLPCVNCSAQQQCYGPDGLRVPRIVVLSFYPFYMLMFKGDLVNGLDFLSLMSGASFEELEDRLGREQQPDRLNRLKILKHNPSVKTPFFYGNEDRLFLEILYLKLCFLGELAEILFSEPHTLCPEFGLSTDRIWIRLSRQNRRLPGFWNFKLELLDVMGADAPCSSIPKFPRTYGFHVLGLIWFYTLLVNGKQGVAQVYPALGEVMEKTGPRNDAGFETDPDAGFPRALSPENIFFNPGIRSVKQEWHKFWKVSLDLGFCLLKMGMSGSKDGSMAEFGDKLEHLRQQIKQDLFSTKPFVPDKRFQSDDDKIIHNILKKIMRMRQNGMEVSWDESETGHVLPSADYPTDDHSAPDIHEDSDIFKTVVLSPDDKPTERLTRIPQKQNPEGAGEVPEMDPDETLILPPQGPEPAGESDTFDHDDQEMEETVILSVDDMKPDSIPSPKREEESLPETVIISPGQGSSGYPQVPPEPGLQGLGAGNTEKRGTVPENTMTGENKKVRKPEPDEFLEETILIRPGETCASKTEDNR
jgi:hypothetical protein